MNDWYLYKFTGDTFDIYYKSPIEITSATSNLIYEGPLSRVEHALGFIHDMMVDQAGHVPTTTEPFVVIHDFSCADLVDNATRLHMQSYKE